MDRYCCALAVVDDTNSLEELTARLERRVRCNKRSVRPIRPFDRDDHALLQAIFRGEFQINGLRNRDLQSLLYNQPATTKAEQRKRSAAISRKLLLLRAHGLIRKRSHSHRYDVTSAGRLIINAILLAHSKSTRWPHDTSKSSRPAKKWRGCNTLV
jgi:hypothetical protein